MSLKDLITRKDLLLRVSPGSLGLTMKDEELVFRIMQNEITKKMIFYMWVFDALGLDF